MNILFQNTKKRRRNPKASIKDVIFAKHNSIPLKVAISVLAAVVTPRSCTRPAGTALGRGLSRGALGKKPGRGRFDPVT